MVALEILGDIRRPFELLLSDVVMPGHMNGYELARFAKRIRPHLKILLTTGFSGNAAPASRGDDSVDILRKPFRRADLARAIETTLAETV